MPVSPPEGRDCLVVRLLGGLQLGWRGAGLAGSLAKKEQALLAYLAYQPQTPFSRGHLASILWSESTESQARYNLRRALWSLRRELKRIGLAPDTCFSTVSSQVVFSSAAPVWVDALGFRRTVETHLRGDERTGLPPDEEQYLRRALDLYQGDFLAGFALPRAPAFEEWTVCERERLFLLLLRGFIRLAQSFLAQGERDEAISICQGLLAFDPIQEDIHRLLMRLYWETGRRDKALQQYQVCRQILQRELGIEPIDETQALYQRVRDHPAPFPPSFIPRPSASRLVPPAQPPDFLPRPRLLPLLDRGLAFPCTLLSAPPGYGKTTLLARWAALSEGHRFRERVAWYTVNEGDNSPVVFLWGWAHALTYASPSLHSFLDHLGEYLREVDPEDVQGVLGILEPLIFSTHTQRVFVLDQAHWLVKPECWALVRSLVEGASPSFHLILATRSTPPLPLARWRLQGRILELGADDLRFTREETAAFLQQALGEEVPLSLLHSLYALTEGWPMALRLTADAWRLLSPEERLPWLDRLSAAGNSFFAYLEEEILDALPDSVREPLPLTALLETLSPAALERFLDLDLPPREWLDQLQRHHLVRRIHPADEAYSYHPLFRRFLVEYLPRSRSFEDFHTRDLRAAEVGEQRESSDRALMHLMLFGLREGVEPRFVSQVLARMGPQALAGVLEMTEDPEPAVRCRAVVALEAFGERGRAQPRIQDALQRLLADPDPDVQTLARRVHRRLFAQVAGA
jgi:DNA-binding SARP family transcriptional activator